ncbi:BN860_14026g1_1 [Zygosaccharomyces bailii CLIB 213]|uniref:BN860_14026g1_1 n=1 Tax=Zygosaccharomyces bailii (strain CLIB 213 / ATCC 58445 / CBS 680 / BCRC 21525 / NBRC 1098 / NCYC 1416 / NRRL Y-2227) TaxID=1333698 RepID=A0A8J2X5G9_ZYGB2|nr:BN860_14026g1_1 [Zygosaccharomyces bailii CLIB 213]
MVVHNPNNWHWVDKNCISWAQDYFKQNLPGLNTGDQDGKFAQVSDVSSVEGDCEVNQRKGKAISLFDLKVVMLLKGHVDETPFEGSISVPEVAFDSEESDYQFEISIYKETSKLSEVKPVIREKLLPQLRSLFQKFGGDLLAEHAGDIQVPESQVNSEFTRANLKGTSVSTQPTSSNSRGSTAAPAVSSKTGGKTATSSGDSNRASLHLEPTFNVPAVDLFRTFLDKQRIMAWSRGSLQSSTPGNELRVGDTFELFGGNVSSKLLEAQGPKKLVFEWRLKEWRSKVVSRLEMVFHESKEYHETKLQVSWSGIPVGEEDRVRGNFEEYYVRSIKLTFGFGAVL